MAEVNVLHRNHRLPSKKPSHRCEVLSFHFFARGNPRNLKIIWTIAI